MRRLDRRLAEVADRAGAPVTIIGKPGRPACPRARVPSPRWSAGWSHSAARWPRSSTASVLTLAAVERGPVTQTWCARTAALHAPCAAPARSGPTASRPPPPVVAIWSGQDGIVPASACRPEDAEALEVAAAHVGLVVNVEVYRHLAEVLVRR